MEYITTVGHVRSAITFLSYSTRTVIRCWVRPVSDSKVSCS